MARAAVAPAISTSAAMWSILATTLPSKSARGNDSRSIFAGRVTALEAEYPMGGGAELVVLAEDRLQELRMKRRTRTF